MAVMGSRDWLIVITLFNRESFSSPRTVFGSRDREKRGGKEGKRDSRTQKPKKNAAAGSFLVLKYALLAHSIKHYNSEKGPSLGLSKAQPDSAMEHRSSPPFRGACPILPPLPSPLPPLSLPSPFPINLEKPTFRFAS
jgi:hypothetical protein